VAIQIQKYRSGSTEVDAFRTPCALEIPKANGVMRAAAGDWILIDEFGEQQPCAPDVFAATYQLVTDGEIAAADVALVSVSASPVEAPRAADAIADASIRECSIEVALDVLIERLAALTAHDAGDHEQRLALARLEEARFWLDARTRH
jgi:hypothetical protein